VLLVAGLLELLELLVDCEHLVEPLDASAPLQRIYLCSHQSSLEHVPIAPRTFAESIALTAELQVRQVSSWGIGDEAAPVRAVIERRALAHQKPAIGYDPIVDGSKVLSICLAKASCFPAFTRHIGVWASVRRHLQCARICL